MDHNRGSDTESEQARRTQGAQLQRSGHIPISHCGH